MSFIVSCDIFVLKSILSDNTIATPAIFGYYLHGTSFPILLKFLNFFHCIFSLPFIPLILPPLHNHHIHVVHIQESFSLIPLPYNLPTAVNLLSLLSFINKSKFSSLYVRHFTKIKIKSCMCVFS